MSQDNVALVRRLYEAFAARDIPAIIAATSPSIDVSQSPELPWGGTFMGLPGFQRFFEGIATHIDSKVAVERLIDAGDHVVVIGRTQGTARATGKTFDVPIAHVLGVTDGKVVSFRAYIDHPTMKAALE